MKKNVLLIGILMILIFPLNVLAANSTDDTIVVSSFKTTKNNVTVWSQPTSTGDSEKIDTIPDKNTVVQIDAYSVNEYGNLWGSIHGSGGYIYISAKNGDVGNLISVSNTTKTHTYATGTDYCETCGTYRLHETLVDLPFVTLSDNVSLHSAPKSSSTQQGVVATANTSVYIVARVVNEYGNHWGLTSDGNYIYMEKLAYNLDAQLATSIQQLYATKQIIGSSDAILLFFDNVQEGGVWDLKDSLNSSRSYKVSVGGEVQSETFTGEELGNIHYGFVGRYLFSQNALLWGGGVVNVMGGNLSLKNCAEYYCDTSNDVAYVLRGINYYTSSVWK